MSRIEDFGEHLSGAAKERWRGYRIALDRARREDADPLAAPLSESFPEPPYTRLIEDGADPRVIALVRALRDEIPARPRTAYKAALWARTVRSLRDLASDLIEGSADPEQISARLAAPAMARLQTAILGRMSLYLELGHARSFRDLHLSRSIYQVWDGTVQNPPMVRYEVVPNKSGIFGRPIVSEVTREEAIEAFRAHLDAKAERPKTRRAPIEIFSWRGHPERGVVLAVKNGPHLIELARLPTVKEARQHLSENRDALERRLSQLRDLPPERGEENRPRTGPTHRGGPVTPELFMERFGFRGVQFGNYVEGARRQADLDRAYEALTDLAEVLGCPPQALSLGGTLGLAFGARGRGGKGAAAAHYEPEEVVINLTKTNGAGSLAHEWFHALDNHLARALGGRSAQYATEMNGPGAGLIGRLASGTGLLERSRQLDRVRSSPYYGTGLEIGARAFEAFVISELAERGVTNDYLANVLAEPLFEMIAAARGQPAGGYPYPREAEIPAVRAAYRALLAAPEVRTVLDQAEDHAETRLSATLTPAAKENGPEQSPDPSDTPDFDWA